MREGLWKDRTLGKIINAAAKKFGYEPSQVSDLIRLQWKFAREAVDMASKPTVFLKFFGVLDPKPSYIKSILDKFGSRMQRVVRERLQDVYKRIKKEKDTASENRRAGFYKQKTVIERYAKRRDRADRVKD